MANSKDIEQTKTRIKQVLSDANSSMINLRDKIQNKRVVIVLGNTKSGKSTFINYIIGSKLNAVEIVKPFYKIQKDNENAEGPPIGQELIPHVVLPNVYNCYDKNIVFIEVQGFGDNERLEQKIINAIFVNQLKYCAMVKFILVVDVGEVDGGNTSGIKNLFEGVLKLLPNSHGWLDAFSVVFTKDWQGNNSKELANLLRLKITEGEFTDGCKKHAKYFVEHDSLIGSFRMPSQSGQVLARDVDFNLGVITDENRFKNMSYTEIGYTLPNKTKQVLGELCENCVTSYSFRNELRYRTLEYDEYFTTPNYIYGSTDEELAELRHFLNNLIYKLKQIGSTISSTSFSDIKSQLTKLFSLASTVPLTKELNLLAILDDGCLLLNNTKQRILGHFNVILHDEIMRAEKVLKEIEEEISIRVQLDIKLNKEVTVKRVGMGASLGAGLLSIGSGIGTIGFVVGAVAAVKSHKTKKELDKRKKMRKQQNRPM